MDPSENFKKDNFLYSTAFSRNYVTGTEMYVVG